MAIDRRSFWRFRLRTLFIMTTIVAIVMGVWIWHARTRIEDARRLANEGVGVLSVSDAPSFLPDARRREIPFARPALAELYVDIAVDGSIYLDGQRLELEEAKRQLNEKRDRVYAAGIKNVHLLFVAHETTTSKLVNSIAGNKTAMALMEYAAQNGFVSTGFLGADQVDARKRSLDPTGIVHPKSAARLCAGLRTPHVRPTDASPPHNQTVIGRELRQRRCTPKPTLRTSAPVVRGSPDPARASDRRSPVASQARGCYA